MRRLLLYATVVLLPAVIVGISNFAVFPDSAWQATLMLVVTLGASAIFTWQSGNATPKIARYCIVADFVICAILCANLAGHWILAREVSAAKQGVVERHAEEDRDDRRKTADAERQLALKKAEAELTAANIKLANAERRRLAQLPIAERRSMLSAPTPEPTQTRTPIIAPMALIPPGAKAELAPVMVPRLTPDQVRESWWWFLTSLAIAECAASVLAGCIWLRSGNGTATMTAFLIASSADPRRENSSRPGAGFGRNRDGAKYTSKCTSADDSKCTSRLGFKYTSGRKLKYTSTCASH